MDKKHAKVSSEAVKGAATGTSLGITTAGLATAKAAAAGKLVMVGTSVMTAGTTGALTAFIASNPVGWTIGAGIAGASLFSYLAKNSD